MHRVLLATIAVAVYVVAPSSSDDVVPKVPPQELQTLDGLWIGTWGGGARDGVVFQPAIAELLIEGDRVEMDGFRDVGNLIGTIRVDTKAKQLRITRTMKAGDPPMPKAIEYAFEIKDDKLTLTGSDKVAVTFQRQAVARNPQANVTVEHLTATKIDAAGDLLVTEFTTVRAGQSQSTYYQPRQRSIKTKQATVLVVKESGWQKIDVDKARGLIRETTPVVVAYRPDDRPVPDQPHKLWKEMGSPAPDSDAVGQTLARTLRPGTLVFIVSSRENAPMP